MDDHICTRLQEAAAAEELLEKEQYLQILADRGPELLPLLQAAFTVRRQHYGRMVAIHILNNVQNGRCSEDCSYCAQSTTSTAALETYPAKKREEILAEAALAYRAGAHRYCMVYAGRKPGKGRIATLAGIIRELKSLYPMELCVSTGIVTMEQALQLKEAGLDRLNHNLNTTPRLYAEICSTHSYDDRVATLLAARRAGLDVCAGIIAGMGETAADLVDLALELRRLEARSIPVNFLLPVPGIRLAGASGLSPEYCLRILCLFRFVNPRADIRAAAGREFHLREMEVLSLYPASSIFLEGYLNTKGKNREKTLRMIRDAGFSIRSDISLDELLERKDGPLVLKEQQDLRPASHRAVEPAVRARTT